MPPSTTDLDLRPADADTVHRVVALLRENDLPHEDVREHPSRFVLATTDSTLVGVGGLEPYGDIGLLRSLAVTESHRGQGYGTTICDALEQRARDTGIETLYLLTTTPTSFFEQRGYEEIDRTDAPEAIQRTTEFADRCPESATCMRREC